MKTLAAIQAFLDNRRALNLRPATIEWYHSVLIMFARQYPELPEEPGKIEAFQANLVHLKRSEQTVRAYFIVLKSFFRFIADRYDVPNPMAKLRAPRVHKKPPRTLEPSEVWRLLNSATNLRDKALLTLLADTGIRRGEVANLRRCDIKTDERGSEAEVRGKSGPRKIPISDETRRLLLALAPNGTEESHVFQGRKGPLGQAGIYRLVRNHMRLAGIAGPKLGSHRLRHGFGKAWLMAGGDLVSLQKVLGHADIKTTRVYAELTDEDILDKHRQFSLLRAAQAAAQQSFLDRSGVIKEAEEILAKKRGK